MTDFKPIKACGTVVCQNPSEPTSDEINEAKKQFNLVLAWMKKFIKANDIKKNRFFFEGWYCTIEVDSKYREIHIRQIVDDDSSPDFLMVIDDEFMVGETFKDFIHVFKRNIFLQQVTVKKAKVNYDFERDLK